MKVKRFVVGDLQSNSYVVSTENECIIIDLGGGYDEISAYIDKENLELKAVLLTHGHFDHILEAKLASKKAPIYIHENDLKMLSSPMLNLSAYTNNKVEITDNVKTFCEGTLNFGKIQLEALLTSGHTKGSCSFICGDYVFSGDTLFLESYGRCDFFGGSLDEMKKSIQKLLALDKNYTVLCGHGEETTILHERQFNPLSNYVDDRF